MRNFRVLGSPVRKPTMKRTLTIAAMVAAWSVIDFPNGLTLFVLIAACYGLNRPHYRPVGAHP
jgi:hypothetical protein